MIASIAKRRIEQVAKADTINASQGDFLVTHVPIKKLQLLKQFDTAPTESHSYSEEQIFQEYILNPENRHQFIAVYGQSGTGKSHLIRWFATRFEQSKPDNEVSLFIRRKDRSLKGTIRQLLNSPEVQNLQNREMYERLVKATEVINEAKLKSMIYHQFLVEVDTNEDESKGRQLTRLSRKRLSAFLSDDCIKARMMGPDGPVERVYAKIAEQDQLLDRDVNAEFLPEDFAIDANDYDDLDESGAAENAKKLASILMSESEGPEQRIRFANYMNLFVPTVVQQCAGIQPNDFEDIFLEIRKGLHALGKNLTIFIEDVTSFTGVDEALLNALMVEHTGLNTEEELCRISSIVGSTIDYLRNNFRDNHKDRITQYVYIPDGLFDGNDRYEFFGRYLNAMSLTETEISRWLSEGAKSDTFPVHVPVEGKEWDTIEIGGDVLNLFPFSKHSIDYFYDYELKQGQRTPRYILQQIIEPVVRDCLFNTEKFPSHKYLIRTEDPQLPFAIQSQVGDPEEQERLRRFLCIWGTGEPKQYSDGTYTFISGIKKEILAELNLPVIQLGKTTAPDPIQPRVVDTTPKVKPDKKPVFNEKLSNALEVLSKWANGDTISVGSLSGTEGTITKCRDDLCAFLFSAINWQTAGISYDNLDKIKSSSVKLVMLEKQSQGSGLWTLKANQESQYVLSVVLRWRILGNSSWNYDGSDFDSYLFSKWIKNVKPELIKAVQCKQDYVLPAICIEIVRQILSGEYTAKDISSYPLLNLYLPNKAKQADSYHSSSWKNLLSFLLNGGRAGAVIKTIQNSFNITQGSGGKVKVINNIPLEECLKTIRAQRLILQDDQLPSNDGIKQRKDYAGLYYEVFDRMKKAAADEIALANTRTEPLLTALGVSSLSEIEEGDIDGVVSLAKEFYATATRNMVDIKVFEFDKVKIDEEKILIAISDIDSGIKAQDDVLAVLQSFSADPLRTLDPLLKLIERIETDIEKTNKALEARKQKLKQQGDTGDSENYQEELAAIRLAAAVVGGLNDE